jgi:transcriptional regulator with XRE-family HTH domain
MYEHGRVFREWRKGQGLTQAEFAEALGVTRRTVVGIENGEHDPGYSTQKRFKELRDERMDRENGVSVDSRRARV